ncbi:hypothetical protein AVEN_201544-1 [Araneus ventricosus]|uniref:Uncharacterized protein n=1 Tax=Araneus ventricosus TaxID=182803 RepID=A0A4Y2MCN8_ARAVE|nr:hypothetical protein AVEN_201544-1 [Araneus ventricosus]
MPALSMYHYAALAENSLRHFNEHPSSANHHSFVTKPELPLNDINHTSWWRKALFPADHQFLVSTSPCLPKLAAPHGLELN